MLVHTVPFCRGELAATIVPRVFQRQLVFCCREIFPSDAILCRILLLSALAGPAAELVGIEVAIAAVDHRREATILKIQQAGVSAFSGPGGIPGAGGCTHSFHAAATEE